MKGKQQGTGEGVTRRTVMKVAGGAVALSMVSVRVGATDSGKPELHVDADIPTGCTIDFLVKEDTSGDGIPNSQDTVSLDDTDDGTTENIVDALDGLDSNAYDYWMEIDMARPSDDATVTPRLTSATIVLPPDLNPPVFDLAITDSPERLNTFESGTVTVEVTNNGEQTGTQTVELAYDGSVSDSESVQLAVGATDTVQLSTPTFGPGDVGTVQAEVSSEDDVAITEIEVVDEDEAIETDPELDAPQAATGDRYLDAWTSGNILQAITRPYTDLLGPIAALISVLTIGGAIQINSKSTAMPLVLTVLLAGFIGVVALPGVAIQVGAILVVIGLAFVGVKIYMEAGKNSR